ncbi:hypothetical protein KAU33_02935 [Candidatus Dependentiae bacterium]|nr:hypothetical protein [Candidatus Dependentiae bacterium]
MNDEIKINNDASADAIIIEEHCDKCGVLLNDDELEEDYRFKKGPVCFKCFLKFLYKKRLIGEIVTGLLAFIAIVSFIVGNYIFGVFFAILLIVIYLDLRSVKNFIIDLESRIIKSKATIENSKESDISNTKDETPE